MFNFHFLTKKRPLPGMTQVGAHRLDIPPPILIGFLYILKGFIYKSKFHSDSTGRNRINGLCPYGQSSSLAACGVDLVGYVSHIHVKACAQMCMYDAITHTFICFFASLALSLSLSLSRGRKNT